jgi:hypothetical protein
MSSSDAETTRAALEQALGALECAARRPELCPDALVQALLDHAVRLYGAKADQGLREPFPPAPRAVTTDEVMVLATDMLHALNVQLFELSMWQAMTGNCVAPGHQSRSTETTARGADPLGDRS